MKQVRKSLIVLHSISMMPCLPCKWGLRACILFVLSGWHTMNHSMCCRAEHHEIAADTDSNISDVCIRWGSICVFLEQSTVKIIGDVAMEIAELRYSIPPAVLITRQLLVRMILSRFECITRKGR